MVPATQSSDPIGVMRLRMRKLRIEVIVLNRELPAYDACESARLSNSTTNGSRDLPGKPVLIDPLPLFLLLPLTRLPRCAHSPSSPVTAHSTRSHSRANLRKYHPISPSVTPTFATHASHASRPPRSILHPTIVVPGFLRHPNIDARPPSLRSTAARPTATPLSS